MLTTVCEFKLITYGPVTAGITKQNNPYQFKLKTTVRKTIITKTL